MSCQLITVTGRTDSRLCLCPARLTYARPMPSGYNNLHVCLSYATIRHNVSVAHICTYQAYFRISNKLKSHVGLLYIANATITSIYHTVMWSALWTTLGLHGTVYTEVRQTRCVLSRRCIIFLKQDSAFRHECNGRY